MLILAAWLLAAGLLIITGVGLAKWLHARYKIVRRKAAVSRTPWWSDDDPDIGWTYQIYDDSNGELLYVGSSKRSPFARFAEHAEKAWWPKSYDIWMYKHSSYGAAHLAEINDIRVLEPRENKIRYQKSAPPSDFSPQLTPLWIDRVMGCREKTIEDAGLDGN